MTGQIWRHKVRGHRYEIITDAASIQMTCDPEVEARYENDTFTVYRNLATGAVWVRPTEEFLDGRFERVNYLADSEEEAAELADNGRNTGGKTYR